MSKVKCHLCSKPMVEAKAIWTLVFKDFIPLCPSCLPKFENLELEEVMRLKEKKAA